MDLYDDNVSGAFLQLNHHIDTTRGNTSLHGNKIIVSKALHFGWNNSPASWVFFAQWMFKNTTYQEEMNDKALNLFTLLDKNNTTEPCIICPQFNKHNTIVLNDEEKFVPKYCTFVDDPLVLLLINHWKDICYFIASIIKSVHILIGYPGAITKLDLPLTKS